MNSNEALVEKFYTAFQQLDAKSMNACYSEDIAFYDPMFELLQGDSAKAMWQMLCKNAKGFSLSFENIQDLGDEYYTCNWTANYIFSKAGRKVINKCKAHMKIENGFITEHSDAWSLHKWSEQALGLPGILLGWAGFFQRRLKNTAKRNLIDYLENKK